MKRMRRNGPAAPKPATSSKNGLAVPTLYLLLGTVASAVQWNKWQALHRSRNLVALVLALFILVVAATYMARALHARRQAGL